MRLFERWTVIMKFNCFVCGAELEAANNTDKVTCEMCGAAQSLSEEAVAVKNASESSISNYIKRVFIFLGDGDWAHADEYCERILDIDPQNSRAYLGKLMAELKISKLEEFKNIAAPFDDSNNYKKLSRFDDGKLKGMVDDYLEGIKTRNENKKIEKKKKKLVKKRRGKVTGIVLSSIAAILVLSILSVFLIGAFLVVMDGLIIPSVQYAYAFVMVKTGNYAQAYDTFVEIDSFLDTPKYLNDLEVCYDKEVYVSNSGSKSVYEYQYDDKGNLIREGLYEYIYTYDEKGKIIERVTLRNGYRYDTDVYSYEYDRYGRVVKKSYDGREYTYEYDWLGNLVAVKDEDGYEYYYDIFGKLEKVITPYGEDEYSYNIRGDIEKYVCYYDEFSYEEVYKYDIWGNNTKIEARYKYDDFEDYFDYYYRRNLNYYSDYIYAFIVDCHEPILRIKHFLGLDNETAYVCEMKYDVFGNNTSIKEYGRYSYEIEDSYRDCHYVDYEAFVDCEYDIWGNQTKRRVVSFEYSSSEIWLTLLWNKAIGKYLDFNGEMLNRGEVLEYEYDQYGNVTSEKQHYFEGQNLIEFLWFEFIGYYFESRGYIHQYEYEGRHVFYKPLNN